MNKLKKFYYHITAYIPRMMPRTEAEFLAFKDILLKYYGVPDEPMSYATLAGQIQSTKGKYIRKSFGVIANNIHRVKINALAQCYRVAASQQLQYELEKKVQQASDAIREDERNKLAEGSAIVSVEDSPATQG